MKLCHALSVIALLPGFALAVEPTIRNVDVRGLQLGGKTTVVIDGDNLSLTPQLLLPFKATKVELKPGNTPAKATFEIELGNEPTPGTYQWRLANDDGVTAPIVIGIDRLPQLPFTPQVATSADLPVALHGQLTGSTLLETKFTGKANQDILIEVEALRIGSKLRPVVHLFDETRKQLAWSWPQRNLFGDTRLVVKLPADGVYSIQLHDVEYQGPAPGFFRLKIGSWQFADVAFPAAVERGKKTGVDLIGRLPTSHIEVNPVAGQYLATTWPHDISASGPRVSLLVSDLPELMERSGGLGLGAGGEGSSLQEISALPVAVNGRLSAPHEQDKYRIAVAAGTKIKLEVFGERIGAALDPVLIVQNEQGVQVARGDDGPATVDPVLEYTVPEKVTAIHVVVMDLLGRGGPAAVYRLVITPVTDSKPQQDFRLFTSADRFRVTQNGVAVLPVVVDRSGFTGLIRMTGAGLPAGVTISNTEIPAGAEGTLVTLNGVNSAAVPAIGTVTLRGTSEDGQLIRDLVFDQHPTGELQPWLRSELAVSLGADSKFKLEWGELPTDVSLLLGNKTALPLKLVRPEGEATAVRLTFVTTQEVPRLRNAPDPNRTIRAEKATEIAADKADGEMSVLVPVNLPAAAYDLAVIGELLSKDKKTVLATSTTTPRRIAVVNPLEVQLANTTPEAKLDPKTGATIKLPGKLQRLGDFKGNVTIAATGLPAGVKIDNVVVKPETSDFELSIVFPVNFKPGDVAGIRVTASGPPDTAKATLLVKAKEIPLTIKLIADAK